MPLPNLPNFEPTVWEQKLRSERLENETLEVRAWREEAENPNTTGKRLEMIAEAVAHYQQDDGHEGSGLLVMEAIVSHPNAPPVLLRQWMRDCARAFCRNPVAPFVLLEAPDFTANLILTKCHALLREENTPLNLVAAIAKQSKAIIGGEATEWEARFHVARAGEVANVIEGEREIQRYWQRHCVRSYVGHKKENEKDEAAKKMLELRRNSVHRLCELSELAFAPTWANRPPLGIEISTKQTLPEIECGLQESTAYPNATLQDLEQIYQSKPTKQMLRFLASHSNTPANLLMQLAQCEDVEARRSARLHNNAPADIVEVSRQYMLHHRHNYHDTTVFERFIYGLHGMLEINALEICGRNMFVSRRLTAAAALPAEPILLPPMEYGRSKPTSRTTRDLLEHLARDGNRLVRWLAQTRLQNPNYVFRWAEPE